MRASASLTDLILPGRAWEKCRAISGSKRSSSRLPRRCTGRRRRRARPPPAARRPPAAQDGCRPRGNEQHKADHRIDKLGQKFSATSTITEAAASAAGTSCSIARRMPAAGPPSCEAAALRRPRCAPAAPRRKPASAGRAAGRQQQPGDAVDGDQAKMKTADQDEAAPADRVQRRQDRAGVEPGDQPRGDGQPDHQQQETAIRIESGLSSVRIERGAATICSIERAELLTPVNERSTLPCYP